jgi:hypothetical protein
MKARRQIHSAATLAARHRIATAATAILAVTGALSLAVAAGPANAAPPSPTAAVSLAGWKLTLPVNSSGCQCGNNATEVNPAAITPPWLVRNSNGSLTFWAPTKGATTPHSLHPRTELVDLSDFTAGSGTHSLKGTFSIQKLPSANDIIIGQIHGGGSSSAIPLLMLHYRSGTLDVVTRKSPTVGGSTDNTLLTGVPMNTAFSYTITQNGSKFVVSVVYGAKTGTATIPVPSSFKGMDVRFQAGDYQQTNANNSPTDGGRLTVTALTAN